MNLENIPSLKNSLLEINQIPIGEIENIVGIFPYGDKFFIKTMAFVGKVPIEFLIVKKRYKFFNNYKKIVEYNSNFYILSFLTWEAGSDIIVRPMLELL